MRVVLNGDATILKSDATIVDALDAVGRREAGFGVAVAVNGEVVPKRVWPETVLGDGDRVEVLAAAQGG